MCSRPQPATGSRKEVASRMRAHAEVFRAGSVSRVGDGITAMAQAAVLLIVLAVAQIGIRWNAVDLLGAIVLLVVATAGFACLSMALAALVRNRERFMGIGQLVMMPLFFASSALYPLAIMPGWLQAVARVNPLTYEVHGMRALMLGVHTGGTLWVDFLVV